MKPTYNLPTEEQRIRNAAQLRTSRKLAIVFVPLFAISLYLWRTSDSPKTQLWGRSLALGTGCVVVGWLLKEHVAHMTRTIERRQADDRKRSE